MLYGASAYQSQPLIRCDRDWCSGNHGVVGKGIYGVGMGLTHPDGSRGRYCVKRVDCIFLFCQAGRSGCVLLEDTQLCFFIVINNMKPLFYGVFAFFLCTVSTQAQTDFFTRLADSALVLTHQEVRYDPAYYAIDYPNGDVPADRGVCTDVVIRAYRKLGIDLQKEVHEDMRAHFAQYPKNWGLARTDRNIDHRRVPNLMTFFFRHGSGQPISRAADAYQPGDIVCWDLGRGLTHIGIVSHRLSADKKRHLIVHNIGSGQVLEDCLFSFPIIGHYRFEPKKNR